MGDKDASGGRYYRDADEKMAAAVATINAEEDIDFVVMLGDFTDGYNNTDPVKAAADLTQINAVFDNLTAPRKYVLGNHETDDLTKAQFIAATGMTDKYYSFDSGDLHCVVLDVNYNADGSDYAPGAGVFEECNIPTAQLNWLTADLAATEKKIVIFTHQRLYPDNVTGYSATNAGAVRAVLEASGNVLAVYQGHRHDCSRWYINGIWYVSLEAMTENEYPANAYSIATVYDNGYMTLTGYDRQVSYP